jgi:hypothetical protein
MSYSQAMEAAGAEILAYESFGSYQGDWYAKVRYQGQVGWVAGSYGSCSGCDAFEGEFGYGSEDKCNEHRYHYEAIVPPCPACAEQAASYQTRLADFGRHYLDLMTQEEAEKSASRNLDWDSGAQSMLDFLKANAI